MGLSIKAYSQARLVAPWPKDGDYDSSIHTAISPHSLKDFHARANGLQPGLYTATEAATTLSIGYTGWSVWRIKVASVVLGRPVHILDSGALWVTEREPLGHLLCFVDNDGILGPATCARLVSEMAEVRARFESAHPAGDEISYSRLNTLGIYDRVAGLLAHGADDGFVRFG